MFQGTLNEIVKETSLVGVLLLEYLNIKALCTNVTSHTSIDYRG